MASVDQTGKWSEEDSQTFIDYGAFYVPSREKHARIITALLQTVPNLRHIVDLCCGEGLLSKQILNTIPGCTLATYDLSEAMLQKTNETLAPYGNRFSTHRFDLSATDWRTLRDVGAFVSSLALHHLNGPEKLHLYQDLYKMLQPGGVLLLIDIILPTRPAGISVAAQEWDISVQQQVEKRNADPAVFATFKAEGWNFFDDPSADPIDQPSGLFEQLQWLQQAGFKDIDVFWMDAGHALFGGWKEKGEP